MRLVSSTVPGMSASALVVSEQVEPMFAVPPVAVHGIVNP